MLLFAFPDKEHNLLMRSFWYTPAREYGRELATFRFVHDYVVMITGFPLYPLHSKKQKHTGLPNCFYDDHFYLLSKHGMIA